MTAGSPGRAGFPRRDAEHRVISLAELLAAAVGGALVALLGLVAIDAVFSAIGFGRFGRTSGWLASILPAFLFVEEFRAWRGGAGRYAVAPVAALVGLGLGVLAAGLVRGLPPVASGAVGAATAVVAYGAVWFVGIRALNQR